MLVEQDNTDLLHSFKYFCNSNNYTDIGYKKFEFCNPLYTFTLNKVINKKNYYIEICYCKTKYGYNDILRFNVYLNNKIQSISEDFIIYDISTLYNYLNIIQERINKLS